MSSESAERIGAIGCRFGGLLAGILGGEGSADRPRDVAARQRRADGEFQMRIAGDVK